MAKNEIELVATEGVFKGLAKQNMIFHQCICELVDNSIASKKENENFKIDIILTDLKNGKVGIYICDNGIGMSADDLASSLQLGRPPKEESNRLHEHGFGLKNSIATLTRGEYYWKIWSSSKNGISSVEGPFGPKMIIEDDDNFPNLDFLPSDISTMIYAETSIDYMITLQGRGRKIKSERGLTKLREYLMEHLGVIYRGYLGSNGYPEGSIFVCIERDRLRVDRIDLPIEGSTTHAFTVNLNGQNYNIEYEYGSLSDSKKQKCKYYYQRSQKTQGIDIRIGNRVISTSVLEQIWDDIGGRHPGYNDFIGELRIPDMPRGVLTTVNNKSDFNLDDGNWDVIFEEIQDRQFRPKQNYRSLNEKQIQDRWINMLRSTNPDETILDERSVWSSGVRIDVYRKKEDGSIILYEMKVGEVKPIDVYQTKMYWDGLEIEGEFPKEAVLLASDSNSRCEEMVNKINNLFKTPTGRSYNIKIETHRDRNLEIK